MQMPKTIQIKNGEKTSPTFSVQEYANRQAKLRAYLAQNNIDTAVFTSYHNINYYSDFLYCSFGRPYALVVTQDSAVTISANIDGGQPWRRTVGTENIVYTDWQRDNYFVAIQQALPLASRIGVEHDHLLHGQQRLGTHRRSSDRCVLRRHEVRERSRGALRR